MVLVVVGGSDGFDDWVVPMGLVFGWFQRWVVVLVVLGSRRGVVVLVLVVSKRLVFGWFNRWVVGCKRGVAVLVSVIRWFW